MMDRASEEVNSSNWVHIPVTDNDYPSLSDNHDYEPGLEFDDSEILNSSRDLTVLPETISLDKHCEYAETPVSDGTIEENFEEELAGAPQVYPQVSGEVDSIHEQDFQSDRETFAQLDCNGLIEVVGDDAVGRRIIVVSACRLPSSQDLHQDKLLRYLMFTLNKYVEQDYSVVYFHHGLSSKNKPTLSWLWKAYKTFDRKYKKNLKALYLVHPTNFIRIVWQMLKPAISVKFGKKMMYVNYLHELRQHLDIDKICIPDEVRKHDEALLASKKGSGLMPLVSKPAVVPVPDLQNIQPVKKIPPTQQFGVSLQFIKENNTRVVDSIPPIVRQCVEFLSQPDALETEGIFRRSTSVALIKEFQNLCDAGGELCFDNPHVPAVLLKAFLRNLDEPLMTFELYDEIIQFQTWSKDDRPRKVKILILEKLPMDNYKLLKYIMQFLWKVMDRSDLNKMTSSNLSVVFGPNLIWPPNGQMSLQAIAPINSFTDFILQNQESIFII